MIEYFELNSKSPEFHEAYDAISLDIDPEFVEPEEYVRERFRIQEQGANTEDERRMIPEGYRIHMLAAKDYKTGKIAGAIYTNFIPKIGIENKGFALVSYLAVLPEFRRQGISTRLVEAAIRANHADALKITGKPAAGLVFEIEDEGKEQIEGLVLKMGGYPLDIDYYQPSVREGCDEQTMNLWFMPFDMRIESLKEAKRRTYRADYIHDLVKSLFVYEYPGPDRSGVKESSKAYQALAASIKGKTSVGFKLGR